MNATDDELRAVATGPDCGYWERQAAKDELDRRAQVAARRGVEVGDTINFVRHGQAPADSSRNHRDGTQEDGVSVYLLEDGKVQYVGWWFGIARRPAYRGRGLVVGFGSDNEPLVCVLEITRDERFDRAE